MNSYHIITQSENGKINYREPSIKENDYMQLISIQVSKIEYPYVKILCPSIQGTLPTPEFGSDVLAVMSTQNYKTKSNDLHHRITNPNLIFEVVDKNGQRVNCLIVVEMQLFRKEFFREPHMKQQAYVKLGTTILTQEVNKVAIAEVHGDVGMPKPQPIPQTLHVEYINPLEYYTQSSTINFIESMQLQTVLARAYAIGDKFYFVDKVSRVQTFDCTLDTLVQDVYDRTGVTISKTDTRLSIPACTNGVIIKISGFYELSNIPYFVESPLSDILWQDYVTLTNLALTLYIFDNGTVGKTLKQQYQGYGKKSTNTSGIIMPTSTQRVSQVQYAALFPRVEPEPDTWQEYGFPDATNFRTAFPTGVAKRLAMHDNNGQFAGYFTPLSQPQSIPLISHSDAKQGRRSYIQAFVFDFDFDSEPIYALVHPQYQLDDGDPNIYMTGLPTFYQNYQNRNFEIKEIEFENSPTNTIEALQLVNSYLQTFGSSVRYENEQLKYTGNKLYFLNIPLDSSLRRFLPRFLGTLNTDYNQYIYLVNTPQLLNQTYNRNNGFIERLPYLPQDINEKITDEVYTYSYWPSNPDYPYRLHFTLNTLVFTIAVYNSVQLEYLPSGGTQGLSLRLKIGNQTTIPQFRGPAIDAGRAAQGTNLGLTSTWNPLTLPVGDPWTDPYANSYVMPQDVFVEEVQVQTFYPYMLVNSIFGLHLKLSNYQYFNKTVGVVDKIYYKLYLQDELKAFLTATDDGLQTLNSEYWVWKNLPLPDRTIQLRTQKQVDGTDIEDGDVPNVVVRLLLK